MLEDYLYGFIIGITRKLIMVDGMASKANKYYKAIIHFNKAGSSNNLPWTIHFKNKCYLVNIINCLVPMVSEWKPNKKTNPRAFFTVRASSLNIENDIATIR
jgi:hypothetical protein